VTLEELVGEGVVERDRPLGPLTTYKFGGPASWFAEVQDESQLIRVLDAAGRLPVLILGRGSNVVIADSGYRGVVIKLGGEFTDVSIDDDIIVAGAGVSLPRLARACASAGRGGLEFYVGIPGSVGGAVVMNAGGHGSDTAEWLIEARILDLLTSRTTSEGPGALDLSYRHSRLSATDLVLGATFRTVPRDREEGERVMREITAWRKEMQPGGTYNAGSVFKNPPGDAAGRIIDSCGLKGFEVGAVAVSQRHANFFVAGDGATAGDVFHLVTEVQRLVRDRTGILLEPEIRFIGDFGGGL
jgi:UDP-N-acetylmuramate dehydrogenase